MASTGNKSSLYPTVQLAGNGNRVQNGERDDDAREDLLAPQDQLVQDVSSTAVLAPRDEEDEEEAGSLGGADDRGNWSGRFDFLMSLLGYSVGLGNVWRFPYLAYSNGGGAFLFPFILMFVLLGCPLMFMELSFGQFAQVGPASIFDRICPLLNGIGYGMVGVSCLVAFYYTCIIGWAFLYLFKSLTSELPWERCGSWATPRCYSPMEAEECAVTNGSVYFQHTCFNASQVGILNLTHVVHNKSLRAPPSGDYFEREILSMSTGIEDVGGMRWEVVGCLLFTWALTFLALSRGVKSVGKVVYFTALFPYVVLTILFFRGVTLDGALDGIIYYITPKFDKLIDAKTWVAAAVQIFFALSPAWGGLITLSSYNRFHNDCFKDALIVGIGNILTSLFAGTVIFSIVGYLAKEMDMDVDKVVKQGPGLAFIVFPDVVTRLPVSPMWSFLFFFMLITLGMGSEFALLETVMTAIQDTYPKLRKKKTWVVLFVCILGFFGGLPICTNGGMYVLQLMDNFAASWAVFIMAFLECLILGWIYGAEKFIQDIEMMIGRKPRGWHLFFTAFWKYLTPATLMFLLVFNLCDYSRMQYSGRVYPMWAEIVGWLMACIPVFIITFMAVWKFMRTPPCDTTKEKFQRLIKHTSKWGPGSKPKFNLGDVEDGKARTITNPGFSTTTNPYDQTKI